MIPRTSRLIRLPAGALPMTLFPALVSPLLALTPASVAWSPKVVW